MTSGFPVQLIAILRCTVDGGTLELDEESQRDAEGGFVRNGTLRCRTCRIAFGIDGGILNMVTQVALDAESRHEQTLRNEQAIRSIAASGTAPPVTEHDSMEMDPTLEALAAGPNDTVLELGSGNGRYTVFVARQCRWIVAVDFSLEALRIAQQRLPDARNLGLVLGDVTTLKVGAAQFDRALSTLVSNLPTREHRNAMYRLAAGALGPQGRFVFGTHHHGIRQRLLRVEKSGRYEHGGIYRYNLTVREVRDEVRPYFEKVDVHPIQIYFPFARTLRLPVLPLSRMLERVPVINGLGELTVCTAERPIRSD